jgi:hypothetical protein
MAAEAMGCCCRRCRCDCLLACIAEERNEQEEEELFILCVLSQNPKVKSESWVSSFFVPYFVPFFTEEFLFSRESSFFHGVP